MGELHHVGLPPTHHYCVGVEMGLWVGEDGVVGLGWRNSIKHAWNRSFTGWDLGWWGGGRGRSEGERWGLERGSQRGRGLGVIPSSVRTIHQSPGGGFSRVRMKVGSACHDRGSPLRGSIVS